MPVPKLDNEAIIKIQALWDEGKTPTQISEITGHHETTVKKYGGQSRPISQGQQPPVPSMQQQPQQARPIQSQRVTLQPVREQKPTTILSSHPATLEPDDWLRAFLEKYGLSSQFIQLMSERVKLVGALPTSSQLANDIQLRKSGMQNKYDAMSIAEFYEYAVRHYLEERRRQDEMFGTPYQGIPVKEPTRRIEGGGIQVDSFSRDQMGHNPSMRDPYRQPYDGQRDQSFPQSAMGGYSQDRLARLEDDLRRRNEVDRQKLERELNEMKMQIAQGGQQDPQLSRLEQKIEILEEERRRKAEEEMGLLKMQITQGMGLREQDVIRMIESREKKLTPDEVARMIDQRFSNQKGKTEIDVKLQELEYDRETKKDEIGEKAKDRETWTQGFETIAKTAGDVVVAFQNRATGQQGTMPGTIGEQVITANCPFCNTPITAPQSAKVIRCPSCEKELEVELPGSEPTQPVIPTRPPVEERPTQPQASFTVEQPPLEQPEPTPEIPAEDRIEAECPFCQSPMFFQKGTSKIACPACGKSLEVSEPQPQPMPEETPPQEVMPEVDSGVPAEPPIEPPKELEEPTPSFPPISTEPKKEIPDWREQLKTKSEPQIPEPPQELLKEPDVPPEEPIPTPEKVKEEPTQIEPEVLEPTEGPGGVIAQEVLLKPFVEDGYTLFKGKSPSGKDWYFFGYQSEKGTPVSELPEGYEIGKNKRSGIPYLKKVSNAKP